MPCRNDWDPPTKAQAENRRAAKLLIALNNIHGKTSTTQLLVDSTNPVLDTDYVKVLCERMKALGELGRDKLLYSDARDPRARDLATWWEEHLERDRKRIEFLRKPGPDTSRAREERDHFKKALHGISLASQSSIGSKEECGRIASKALEEARQWRIKATDEQQAQGADRPVPSAVLKDSLNKILDASVAQQITDAAYTERNHLVALLSKIYPAGKARTAIEGWSPEWHGCVYIDFPWGQASWHYHDRDAGLFNHLEPYRGSWDGHTTEAKYELIRQVVVVPQEQANMGPGRHWWPVSKGHADNVCAAAPQQAEPVAQIGWADEFGNLFPMAAWKPAQRTHHDSHKTAWRPVFLHPPAAEVQLLRDAVAKLSTIVRVPNAEHIADEHNAAVAFLRRALEGGE